MRVRMILAVLCVCAIVALAADSIPPSVPWLEKEAMVCDDPSQVRMFADIIETDKITPDDEIVANVNKAVGKSNACVRAKVRYTIGEDVEILRGFGEDEHMVIREVFVHGYVRPRELGGVWVMLQQPDLQYGLFKKFVPSKPEVPI